MTEEIKQPEPVGKPARPFADRLAKMSWKNLQGEANRLSKKPESKLGGAIADVLLTVFFKTHNKGNDPYMLELNNRDKKNRGFEIR